MYALYVSTFKDERYLPLEPQMSTLSRSERNELEPTLKTTGEKTRNETVNKPANKTKKVQATTSSEAKNK